MCQHIVCAHCLCLSHLSQETVCWWGSEFVCFRFVFEGGEEELCASHCWLQVSLRLCSLVCVCTIWRMIWSNCSVFMFIHQSLIKENRKPQGSLVFITFSLLLFLVVHLDFWLFSFSTLLILWALLLFISHLFTTNLMTINCSHTFLWIEGVASL